MSISPFTPRRSGRRSAAPAAAIGDESRGPGCSGSAESPKRMVTPRASSDSAKAGEAARGSRCASRERKDRAAEAAGEIGLQRRDAVRIQPLMRVVRRAKRVEVGRVAQGASTRLPRCSVPGKACGQRSALPGRGRVPAARRFPPRTRAPACRRHSVNRRARRGPALRSSTRDAAPPSTRARAVVRPATPAPTTVIPARL